MARLARVVVAGLPHHVVQRGNRRQPVFFEEEDRFVYLKRLKAFGEKFGIDFWAYCLMDNHIHLIAVPETEQSLSRGLGDAHKSYTRLINFRHGWRGYLFQGRFSSYPLDEPYLYAAIRYVERNPVRAKLVTKAEDYPYSSAKAHVFGLKDLLLTDCFLTQEIKDWRSFLLGEDDQKDQILFEHHAHTGRPLGNETFLKTLEQKLGRVLQKGKPGPKGKN